MGDQLSKLFPNQRVALIKYSRSGSSIAEEAAGQFGCWEPDFEQGDGPSASVNQYDHFLKTVRMACAVRDIDGDGTEDRLIPAGIIWMQGESDANAGADVAQRYSANLKRLMDLIRAAFRTDDLAVVIGRISDSGQDTDGRRPSTLVRLGDPHALTGAPWPDFIRTRASKLHLGQYRRRTARRPT